MGWYEEEAAVHNGKCYRDYGVSYNNRTIKEASNECIQCIYKTWCKIYDNNNSGISPKFAFIKDLVEKSPETLKNIHPTAPQENKEGDEKQQATAHK